ncbi:MAG: ATP-dependent helicase, partial [Solirubrobacterales bacterium]|nr:ATP-dependent helicase [Solirubrobacterales bacterium]
MRSTAAAEGLSPPDLISHAGSPLLIEGAAGTGKTTLLKERFRWLIAQGTPPERIVFLTPSNARADAVRARLEQSLGAGYGELTIVAPTELACGVLARAPGRGHIPDAILSAGERLAMLAEAIEELPLTQHDFGGNANALLAGLILRIDALKQQLISPEDHASWAQALDDDAALRDAVQHGRLPVDGAREREFAEIYAAHERLLKAAGAIDHGDLLRHAIRAAGEPRREPFQHVLIDDAQELSLAAARLATTLANGQLTVAGDPQAGANAFRGAGAARLRSFETPDTRRAVLTSIYRMPRQRFWRAESERAQGQAVAAEIERLIRREQTDPGRIAVLVPDTTRDGRALAAALEERAVPHRVIGDAAFFQRAEIRDLLAWLRLLADPADASAAVRVLARPPIELRSVDMARCTQIARRRKLDMVAALAAATESPQVPPEARERIRTFLKLYRASATPLDSTRPDLYVYRLIERLGLRRRHLFSAHAEVV